MALVTAGGREHAPRELDPDGRLPALEYADPAAALLDAFAQRDHQAFADSITAAGLDVLEILQSIG